MNTREGEGLRGQWAGRGRLEKSGNYRDNMTKPTQCLLSMSHRRFTERQAQEAD